MARALVLAIALMAAVLGAHAKAGDGTCLYDPIGAPLANPPRLGEVIICMNVNKVPIPDQWCNFRNPPPLDPADGPPPPGEGTCTPCTVCGPNQYVKSPCQATTPTIPYVGFTNTVCANCPLNCASCSSATVCSACKAGFTLTATKTCVATVPVPGPKVPGPAPTPSSTRAPPPPPKFGGRRMV